LNSVNFGGLPQANWKSRLKDLWWFLEMWIQYKDCVMEQECD
jgi:hypothetical protein